MGDFSRAGRPVRQWMLTDHGPMDEQVHIQVGTVDSEYYVDHTGFGHRRYPDRKDAWHAVQSLMRHNQGNWRVVRCDDAPFAALRPPNGARFLYDTDGDCLYGHWGDLKGARWDKYQEAMDVGRTFRRTKTHALLGGFIEAIAYREPDTGVERYAVASALEEGGDFYVVDYPDRAAAVAAYEKEVRAHVSDTLPYQSSDMSDPDIVVARKSPLPKGMVMLDDGALALEEDVEYMYGPPPSPITWPRTLPLDNPTRVRGMTTDARDWGPGEVRLTEVTPRSWNAQDPTLKPNSLALLTLADGRQLLASADDSAAHVWSVRDGSPIRTVVGHSERVLSVALVTLADGRLVLATGGLDGFARAWDVGEGEVVRELKMEDRTPVNAVAWVRPPGDVPWLVTAGDDAMVRVWNPKWGETVAELELGEPRMDVVWSVATAVLADGHVCVVAGAYLDLTLSVHVWDVTAGKTLHQLTIDKAHPHTAAVHVDMVTVADGSFRFAAAAGSAVWVWDGLTGDVVRTLSLPETRKAEVALAALPDLRVAVAANGDGRTCVWDTESGVELASVTQEGMQFPDAVDLATTPAGDLLLATGLRNDAPARLLCLATSEDGH
jgi:WD40 repeat protein